MYKKNSIPSTFKYYCAQCRLHGVGSLREGPKTIIAVLNEATLLVFDDYTKERCIAAFLLAKKVYWEEIYFFIKKRLFI